MTSHRVRPFAEIDAESVEVRCKEVGGKKFYNCTVGGESTSISLTPDPSVACPVVYGLRTDGQYERPGFLEGAAKAAREGLSITLLPTDELKAFLQRLDIATERAYRAAGGKGEWAPLVSPKGTLNQDCFKVKVIFAGKGLTELKIKEDDEVQATQGSGWQFAKDLVDKYWGFKGIDCMIAVKLHSVWCVSGRAGLSLHASWLYVLGGPASGSRAEEDPFKGF